MEPEYPWSTRLAAGAAAALVPPLLESWFSTCRVRLLNPERERELFEYGQVAAFLHKNFLFVAWHYRRRGGAVMVSRSRDGEMVTRVCRRLGTLVVRGSSSRGGATALLELIELGRRGRTTSMIVDGPRGPAGVAKPGVVVAARAIGKPILPVGIVAEDAVELKNWDRTALPRPYSRIAIKYGDPIHVPAAASGEEYERIRRTLDESFVHLQVELRVWLARTR